MRTYKVSRDPAFAAKVTDVVGLYLNPPDNAIVLSVDEKTQIQALERTQLPLPAYSARSDHPFRRYPIIVPTIRSGFGAERRARGRVRWRGWYRVGVATQTG